MSAFDSAWSSITKALPEQQAFEQFYTHGGPTSMKEFGHPPTFEEIPRIAQERRGTVHPAIIAMLQRAAARERGSSYFPGERLDHNVPRSRHDEPASLLIQDEDAKPSHNILVEPPYNQRSRKNRAGFMLQDAPDRSTLAMNDPDREIRERRQEDAGPTHRDFEFYMPDGGDPRYGGGKYRSIRQKTPDGQDIVTAGSMFSDPSYPEFDYEIDYSDRPTYEEMYGEPPVGRDTRFINTGEPMDMSWRLLKNLVPTSPSDPMGAQVIDSMFCQNCKQGLNPGNPQCENCGAPSGMSMRNVMGDGNTHSEGQKSMIERARQAMEAQKRSEGQ